MSQYIASVSRNTGYSNRHSTNQHPERIYRPVVKKCNHYYGLNCVPLKFIC